MNCFLLQLIFEGIRGRSYHGDIAIDDISVAGGQCNAPGETWFLYPAKLFYAVYFCNVHDDEILSKTNGPPHDKTKKMTYVPSENSDSAWSSAQSDQSSQCAQWVAKDPNFLHADSKDSDQTGRMPRLIWVFAGRTCHFVGFVMKWLKSLVVTIISNVTRKRVTKV